MYSSPVILIERSCYSSKFTRFFTKRQLIKKMFKKENCEGLPRSFNLVVVVIPAAAVIVVAARVVIRIIIVRIIIVGVTSV